MSISKTTGALMALLISASAALAETPLRGSVAETPLRGMVVKTLLPGSVVKTHMEEKAVNTPPVTTNTKTTFPITMAENSSPTDLAANTKKTNAAGEPSLTIDTKKPLRVVSVNLCTDQLAMLMAPPEQLISVSYLARDPMSSAMSEQAKSYAINHGQAEEIVMLRPDLVLAQEWTSPILLSMLDHFEIPYVKFKAVTLLDEVVPQILQMGDVLGQSARADELAKAFEARRGAISKTLPKFEHHPRIAAYGANGWVGGSYSLAADVFRATGFENIAGEAGLENGGFLSLEKLITTDPDVILISSPYPGSSRGETLLAHPAIASLSGRIIKSPGHDAAWDCGTPLVLNALEAMGALSIELAIGGPS